MKCEMCGQEFEEEVCSACSHSCRECRCPACGYSIPPPSRLAGFIRNIGGKKDDK